MRRVYDQVLTDALNELSRDRDITPRTLTAIDVVWKKVYHASSFHRVRWLVSSQVGDVVHGKRR